MPCWWSWVSGSFFGVPKRAVKAGRSMALKVPTTAKGSVAKKAALKVDAYGYPIPEEGEVRDSFNIVLSMPKGTDVVALKRALKRAVREFAAAEFEHHQYVMAMHTWDTDPDPNPSPHPHVHLAVKARSDTGVRLNPRKADLQRWRETFVQTLRANGIEAVATKRVARMQRAPGERQSVRQLKIRGGVPNRMVRRNDEVARRAGAVLSDGSVPKRYREVAAVLRESSDSKDWRLALALLERFVSSRSKALGGAGRKPGLPESPNPPEAPPRDRDRER